MEPPRDQARTLPARPGVYLLRDDRENVLYVGKASNLQNRVRSYFGSQPLTPKLARMVARIARVEFIVTASEQEAFILENTLIKKHKPRYNVNLKDDKTYPYLKITLAEEWPRVLFTRRLKDDGSRYFGPYAGARSLRQTMDLLNKLFPFRTCKKSITAPEARPCLKYHIGRCSGPCIGAVNRDEYRDIISRVILFLGGKHEQVIRDLKKKMQQASRSLEFERAASLRDQIHAIERIVEQQKVVSPRKTNADVVAFARETDAACVQVLSIRGGKLIGSEHFVLQGTQDEPAGTVMTGFLQRYYDAGAEVPPEVVLEVEPDDRHLIEKWLEDKRGGRVTLAVPRRGDKRLLVRMAQENAAEILAQMRTKWFADAGKTGAALEELREHLGLPSPPARMECYDISNIRGTSAVGSMVVFEEGRPRPSHYRRFKIKGVEGIDDYAMMQETLRRRFARVSHPSESAKDATWASMPDLILIDGGRGHLSAGLSALHEMGIDSVAIAGIAKQNEEVFLPNRPDPLILPRSSQALHLLQRLRDEAHRFAISYHTRVRKKAALTSTLDSIPGIGPKRKRNLIRHFGSVKAMQGASIEELSSVPGITRAVAERIKDNL